MSDQKTSHSIINARPAGEGHQVVTVKSTGGKVLYRREPCPQCPWRVDATGVFPPEAFRHSARTAYDMAEEKFGCHDSGADKPATCAGFLLRGADHNLTVRVLRMKSEITDDVCDGNHALHEDYRAMAIANGVDPDDPVLKPCR